MSLPAYLFLYDENGMQVTGDCMAPGREGAIEVMNSSYGIRTGVDSHTGNLTGTRQHNPVIIHKQLDKVSPYLANVISESRRYRKRSLNIMRLSRRELKLRSTASRWKAWLFRLRFYSCLLSGQYRAKYA